MIHKSTSAASYYIGQATSQSQNVNKIKSESHTSATKTEEAQNPTKLTRAQEIKAQIESGEYKINLGETAKRMAQQLLM